MTLTLLPLLWLRRVFPLAYDIGGTTIEFEDIRLGDIIGRPIHGSWLVGEVTKLSSVCTYTDMNQVVGVVGDEDLRLIGRPRKPLSIEPGSVVRTVVTVHGVWFPFAIRTFYPEGGEYCEWVGLRASGWTTPVASHEIKEWEDV